ncbi:hypothetical protein, partial [Pseudomonas aeruginosa]
AHRLARQKEAGGVSGEHFQTARREVIRIWREMRLGGYDQARNAST